MSNVSRKSFIALSAAAALSLPSTGAFAGEAQESEGEIKEPIGMACALPWDICDLLHSLVS